MRAVDHPAARTDFDGNTLDAEREVIGGIFANQAEGMAAVDGAVAPDDFGCAEYGTIFEAIRRVYAGAQAIDLLTVGAELRAMDRLTTVGGSQAVAAALDGFRDYYAPLLHLEAHARIVREAAQARRASKRAEGLVARIGRGAPFEVLQRDAAAIVADLAGPAERRLVAADKGVEGVLERMARAGEGVASSVTLGSRALDALTGGVSAGQLAILAARPAMGKTSLAMSGAIAAAKAERLAAARERRVARRVLFVSLEMPESELYGRAIATEARINNQKILRPGLAPMSQDDADAVQHAVNALHGLPLLVLDLPAGSKLSAIRATAKREHARSPLLKLHIDYLQLVGAETRSDNREREVAEVSRGLKALAKELGVPIVALSQLNRGLENRSDKRPMLADLRESGAIEQDADIVMFVYRDEVYNRDSTDRGIAEVIVAKQRNGPCDTVRLRFLRECTRFEEMFADMGAAPAEDDAPRVSMVHERPGVVGSAVPPHVAAALAGDGLPGAEVPSRQLSLDEVGPQDAADDAEVA